MTSPRSQLAKDETPFWFCLQAQPKREHLAAAGLRRCGIHCFSPRLRFRKMTRRGAIWFVEAMFPGYLFAQFVYAQDRRRVEHASGVRRIVQFGEQIATIDPGTIVFLQEHAGEKGVVTIDPEIKVGQSVRITDGPLQNLEALVVRLLPAKERVCVLLEMLGRSVSAELPLPRVIAVRGD